MKLEAVAIAISAVALIVSVVSLWMSHLSPFRLAVAHGTPTFTLYNLSDTQKAWWVPSFDLRMSFHNSGHRVGEVIDIRMDVRFATNHSGVMRELFNPSWIVNYGVFHQTRDERLQWIMEAVERIWCSIVLPGRSVEHQHLVLEAGGWNSVMERKADIFLEVFDSKSRKWKRLATYELAIDKKMYAKTSAMMLGEPRFLESRRESGKITAI